MKCEQMSSLQVASVVCVFMLEPTEECLCDTLLEIDTRIFCNNLLPDIFRKFLISNAQDIEPHAVIEQLDLNGFVGCDTGRCVQCNRVPSCLNPSSRHLVMLEKLANGIRAVDLETVCLAAEPLQKSKVMERGTDEKQFRVKVLFSLTALFVGPEEDAMGVIEEKRRTQLDGEDRLPLASACCRELRPEPSDSVRPAWVPG